MTPLRVCEACNRHVLVSEQSCPFCSAALGPAPERVFGKRVRAGMSRAQIFAVAATVTSPALGACSDTVTRDDDGNAGANAGHGGDGSGTGGAATGGSAGTAGAAGTLGGSGGEIFVPEYGGVFPLDSGTDEDAGEEIDIPIYSAPNPRE